VLSLAGLALSGTAQIFEQEATADDSELKDMLARARANLGEIDPGISEADIETKLVEISGMKARAEQIRDRYVAALAEDDQKRSEKRQAMHDLGNRIRTERTPGSGSGSSRLPE
jgi:hypothetical protein